MRASASSVRSTTIRSAGDPGATTSCPASASALRSLEPKSRSGQSSATRATPLLGAPPAELPAHGLGAAPHLEYLHPPDAHLAGHERALDPLTIEHRQGPVGGLARRRVAEVVR